MNKLKTLCALLRKWWDDFFWIKEIFALEFGTSDVQSNYSRVYAWMANQLGHMTLGLAVALLFVWIVETSQSAIINFSAWRGNVAASDLACQWGNLCIPSNVMLGLTFGCVLAGLIGFLLWWALSGRCHQPPTQTRKNAYPRIPKPVAIICHAAVALGLIGVVIYALGFTPAGAPIKEWATLMGTLIATLMIAAGIVVLCKDLQILILSLFGLAIVFVLGSEVLKEPLSTTDGVAKLAPGFSMEFVVIALLLISMAATTYWLRYRSSDYAYMRKKGANCRREMAGGVFVIMFLGILYFGLDDAWREALTAAFASVTLWWVKEFGSDIPGVQEEIGRARDQRPAAQQGSEDDYDQVELDYLTDARMDARTDGLFYIAGAWIGAAVISDMPVLTDNSWETGAELVGCIIFVVIFMVEGRRWSFRQVALDRMGARQASRLAVFRSAIKMVTIEPDVDMDLGTKAPEDYNYNPLPINTLDKFARSEQCSTNKPLDHVFVFGAPGAGRTPLGLALASEAALASHSTVNDGGVPKPNKRTGRYLRLNQLEYLLRDVVKRTQLQAHPPQPVWFNKQTGMVRPEGSHDTIEHEREDAASLIIVDDVEFIKGITPVKACGVLDLASGTQQTVWMFPTDETMEDAILLAGRDELAWKPDYRTFEKQIGPLRDAINKAAGARQRIGIVFVRRYKGPDAQS